MSSRRLQTRHVFKTSWRSTNVCRDTIVSPVFLYFSSKHLLTKFSKISLLSYDVTVIKTKSKSPYWTFHNSNTSPAIKFWKFSKYPSLLRFLLHLISVVLLPLLSQQNVSILLFVLHNRIIATRKTRERQIVVLLYLKVGCLQVFSTVFQDWYRRLKHLHLSTQKGFWVIFS